MIPISKLTANIKKELGSFFSTEAHTSVDLIRYINSAVKALCISKSFWFNKYSYTINVVSWQTEYTIPYQIQTFYVLDSSWEEVEMLWFEDYHKLKDKSNCIMVEEEKLITTAISWAYTIYYVWFPPQVFNDEDTLEIPEHFADTIVVKAVYYWFMDIKAYEKAATKETIFNWMIKSIATRSSDKKPMQVKRLNKSKSSVF